MSRAALAWLAAAEALFAQGLAVTALAQERERILVPPRVQLELAPSGVQYVVTAAESILSSGALDRVSLESFNAGIATGVYLYGDLHGELESVGYGRDPGERRYLWLSVARGDSLEYMAMLYDVDRDLAPDFLLLRTVDWNRRAEFLTEFRTASIRDVPLDITIQSACMVPRCNPATWTVHERSHVEVPPGWLDMWRPALSLAAMRGERWIGKPMAALPSGPPRDGP